MAKNLIEFPKHNKKLCKTSFFFFFAVEAILRVVTQFSNMFLSSETETQMFIHMNYILSVKYLINSN